MEIWRMTYKIRKGMPSCNMTTGPRMGTLETKTEKYHKEAIELGNVSTLADLTERDTYR